MPERRIELVLLSARARESVVAPGEPGGGRSYLRFMDFKSYAPS